jgi:hypothetical protein
MQGFLNLPQPKAGLINQELEIWKLYQLKHQNIKSFKERLINMRKMKNVLHQIVVVLEKTSEIREYQENFNNLTNVLSEKGKLLMDLENMFDECSTTLLESMGRTIKKNAISKKQIESKQVSIKSRLALKIKNFSLSMLGRNKAKKLGEKTEGKKKWYLKEAKSNLVFLLDSDSKKVTEVLQRSKEVLSGIKFEITKIVKQILSRCVEERLLHMRESVVFYAVKLRRLGCKISKETLVKFSSFEIDYIKRMSKAILIKQAFQEMGSKLFKYVTEKYSKKEKESGLPNIQENETRPLSIKCFKKLYNKVLRQGRTRRYFFGSQRKSLRKKRIQLTPLSPSENHINNSISKFATELKTTLCPYKIYSVCESMFVFSETEGVSTKPKIDFDSIMEICDGILVKYFMFCLQAKNADKEGIKYKIELLLGADSVNDFLNKYRFYRYLRYK